MDDVIDENLFLEGEENKLLEKYQDFRNYFFLEVGPMEPLKRAYNYYDTRPLMKFRKILNIIRV